MADYIRGRPTVKLCSDSPRIMAFEKHLSLIKTPDVLAGSRYDSSVYSTSPNDSNDSESTLVNENPTEQLERQLNSLKRSTRFITSKRNLNLSINDYKLSQSPLLSAVKSPTSDLNAGSPGLLRPSTTINFHVPMQELSELVKELQKLAIDTVHFIKQITRQDVEWLVDGLSEFFIGVFVTFGVEVLDFRKDLFLILTQLVLLSFIRICFRNDEYDSLFIQSPIVSILERSNLHHIVKRSITHLIALFQGGLLLSILRVTAAFKSKYLTEDSKLDSFSLMGLGLIIILLSLNLIINSLPASRRYSE